MQPGIVVIACAALLSGLRTVGPWSPATDTGLCAEHSGGSENGGAGRAPATARSASRDLTIGVSTVGFPPYLERKEIVTRATDSQLVVHRFDKWGSAPDEDFARTVAANLRVLLPTAVAVTPPFRPELPLDYEVRFTVERFERLADGTVVLDARWVVLKQPEGRALASPSAQIRIPTSPMPYPTWWRR